MPCADPRTRRDDPASPYSWPGWNGIGRSSPDAGHQPPAARQGAYRGVPDVAADVLEDHVDPPLAGQPHHLGLEVLFLVVDRFVRAETLRSLQLLVGAGGGKDARPDQLRDLDAGDAHAGPGRLD